MELGERIGQYELIGHIGDGGMGQVYHAYHRMMCREVAIKFARQDFGNTLLAKMFRREIEASSRVSHANVLTAFDAGIHDDMPYLVTEYLPGPDLSTRVAREGPLELRDALDIAIQIASGLQAIHEQGIIHRDVKPGNIKRASDTLAKIFDFGIAKISEPKGADPFEEPEPPGTIRASVESGSPLRSTRPSETQATETHFVSQLFMSGALDTMVGPPLEQEDSPRTLVEPDPSEARPDATIYERAVGTPIYMSPEQMTTPATIDTRTDIYALGCTLFYLLTGESNVDAKPSAMKQLIEQKSTGQLRRLRDLLPDVPPGLEAVLDKMTAPSPDDRFSTMALTQRALEDVGVTPKIFLSYRREDAIDATDRLYERLSERFGADSVFMDVDSIPAGSDFKSYIERFVAECDAVLTIIGDHFLDRDVTSGTRRIDDPDDLVRTEIEAALANEIPLFPVLVGRAQLPESSELPSSVRDLRRWNAAEVRPGSGYADAVANLMEAIHETWRKRAMQRVAQAR